MSLSVWFIISAVVAMTMAAVALRALWPRRAPVVRSDEGESVSSAPASTLQRLAWWSLALGVFLTVAIVAVVFKTGPAAFHDDPRVRVPVTLLIVGGAVLLLVLSVFARRQVAGNEVAFDERDLAILSRAPAVQSVSVLVTLAVWIMVLTEVYWATSQVPIVYLGLIFWSCFLVNLLALPVGILLGYRKG